MRDIKFRAWDKAKKAMMYRGVFDRNWYTESVAGKCINGIHPDDAFSVNLMQYTGLKDANGAEIYEGDIVNVPYNRIGNIEVEFNDGAYNLSRYDVSQLKVIGNKYENPELLKGAK